MSQSNAATAAIRAHADGYNLGKRELMGRQAAGHGFLRAAVAARGDRPIYGVADNAQGAAGFAEVLQAIDPAAPFEWIPTSHAERIGQVGVFYLADPTLAAQSRSRFRHGAAAYSLCGVTHTTASHNTMTALVDMLREPVGPWDALICTSSAVAETVRQVHEAETDYLRWRLGPEVRVAPPQFPVIPLGVHCSDFEIAPASRVSARRAMNIADDAVVALFVGRLVYHAKAHPWAMYRGLQAVARRTRRPIVLIMCGWAPNELTAGAFRGGAADFAPDVRTEFVEGRDPVLRDQAWAAADMFVSLSDNIQETFGLTPVEAMAAGLPVVVSDWNGYRDTVRDGVDGLRTPTWAPGPGMGLPLAAGYQGGLMSYDRYCWAAAACTSVDLASVEAALLALVEDGELRARLGEAGRRRAREAFDWSVVYRRYQDLWSELNARRAAAHRDPAERAWLAAAPKALAAYLDPFLTFGHYPTRQIGPDTRLAIAAEVTMSDLAARAGHNLFVGLPTAPAQLQQLFQAVLDGCGTVAGASARLDLPATAVSRGAGQLAKMGLIVLS